MSKRGKKEPKIFLADPPLAREIEEFRFDRRYGSEGAALRDIVRAGLDTLTAKRETKDAMAA